MKKTRLFAVKLFLFLMIFSIGSAFANVQKAEAATNLQTPANRKEATDMFDNQVMKCGGTGQTVSALIEGNIGSLLESLIICPMLRIINTGIVYLTVGDGNEKTPLTALLELPPINPQNQNSSIVLLTKGVVNLANAIYVVVFLFLIFASSLPINVDSYTIKKTLPKLIIAVILTQFSLTICSILIDFFNLLGYIVPGIIFGITQFTINAKTAVSGTELVSGTGAMIAGTNAVSGAVAVGGLALAFSGLGGIIMLILSIIALVALIMAFIYMIIRFFVLYILVIIAPFAFVAWVIPGTSKFFGQWWKTFVLINAMFAAVMALMSGSIVLSIALNDLLGGKSFIPSLLPIIALFMIPKVLKATTKGMNSLTAGALGFVGGMAAKGAATAKGAAKKGGKMAYGKGKAAAGEAAKGFRMKKAEEAFGRGDKEAANRWMGHYGSSADQKTQEALNRRAAERAKEATGRAKNSANNLEGLDLTSDKAGIQNQLQARGVSAENAARQAQIIHDRTQQLNAAGYDIKGGRDLAAAELATVGAGGQSAVLGLDGSDAAIQSSAIGELGNRGEFDSLRSVQAAGVSQDKITSALDQSGAIGKVATEAGDIIKGPKAYESVTAVGLSKFDKSTARNFAEHYKSTTDAAKRAHMLNELEKLRDHKDLPTDLNPEQKAMLNQVLSSEGRALIK